GRVEDHTRSGWSGEDDDRHVDGEHRSRGGAVGRMTPRRAPRGAGEPDLDLFAPEPPPQPAPAPRAQKARRPATDPERVDSYPGETAQSAVTVTMLSQAARDVIEGAFIPLWVRGEVSDFKAHRNGHWYFCLRDRTAQIKCVVWSRDQRRVPASPD